MDETKNAERAAKSNIIDRVRLLVVEDNLEAVERDKRTKKMYEMGLDELQFLEGRIWNATKNKKPGVLVEEITKSEHRRAGIA
jgi:hypothetical protein